MVDEPHTVVQLLLKRMESHPEEFAPDGEGRWAQWLDELIPFVTEAERVLLRGPMMQSIHERVMDELMNGPERRAKEAEEREYERHLAQAMQHTQKQQQLAAQQQMTQRYQNAVGQYQSQLGAHSQAGITHIAGQSPNIVPVANGGTAATTGTLTNTINQIREMLGAKK
jgi:hypothetical protein